MSCPDYYRAGQKLQLLAYVRVSTKKQKKARAYLTQEKAIKDWAKTNKHTIIGWYKDLGISGAEIKERYDYQRMLRDIKEKGDGIVAFRLSRTSRSLSDLLSYVKYITEELDKHIFYVADPIDTSTPYGRFILHMLGAIVELQREIIRENTELGRERAREEGKSLGGPKLKKISRERVERELKRGFSPEQMAVRFMVSGKTIRRRMKDWSIYDDYSEGKYTRGEL